ncbi:MAG: hypothetical protein D6675_00455 [Gemmatimonadetes bacterium]|nr:MAG: hypothetical protein D6675_00455 [Gemmatimonadota bacterium]
MAYQHAFLIIIDGLPLNTFQQAEIPFIRQLIAAGAQSTTCEVNTLPTVSRGAHATIATGVTPAQHGIYGNRYYDRIQKRVRGFGPAQLRRVTFAHYAEQQGKRVAVTGNKGLGLSDGSLEALLPGDEGGSGALEILGKGASILRTVKNDPMLRDARRQILSEIQQKNTASYTKYIEFDNVAARLVFDILEHDHPDILAVNFVGADKAIHAYGPTSPEALQTLANIDRLIQCMFERVNPHQTFCLITADHGNTAVTRHIDLTTSGTHAGSIEAIVTEGRRSARIYLSDRASLPEVEMRYRHHPGVGLVKVNHNDPFTNGDLWLYAAGQTTFGVDTKITRRACHGSPADSDRLVPMVIWNPLQANGYRIQQQTDIAGALAHAMNFRIRNGSPTRI